MSLAFSPADARYIAFVDEAGDPGLGRIQTGGNPGSSEWLILSAVVVRIERERGQETVQWIKDIRESIRSRQGPALHYRGLTDDRKRAVCEAIAGLPLRAFVLASNKKNMEGYGNPRAEAARGASTQEFFYNFCIRLLLERVTLFVERLSLREHREPKHVELVFSERGGLRYSQTIEYLWLLMEQARSNTTYLPTREVRWAVLHPQLMRAIPHNRSAGCQLADPVASAFFQATNAHGAGKLDPQFAVALRPRIWRVNGKYENNGLCLQPTPYSRANLTETQKHIFRSYGFRI
jgi:hypothetical protein